MCRNRTYCYTTRRIRILNLPLQNNRLALIWCIEICLHDRIGYTNWWIQWVVNSPTLLGYLCSATARPWSRLWLRAASTRFLTVSRKPSRVRHRYTVFADRSIHLLCWRFATIVSLSYSKLCWNDLTPKDDRVVLAQLPVG
jgi:hypothetical protein